MKGHKLLNSRRLSVTAFSFSFAYLLSFLFEGQVLYSLLDLHGLNASTYILAGTLLILWASHLRSVCQVLGGSQKNDARRYGRMPGGHCPILF